MGGVAPESTGLTKLNPPLYSRCPWCSVMRGSTVNILQGLGFVNEISLSLPSTPFKYACKADCVEEHMQHKAVLSPRLYMDMALPTGQVAGPICSGTQGWKAFWEHSLEGEVLCLPLCCTCKSQ